MIVYYIPYSDQIYIWAYGLGGRSFLFNDDEFIQGSVSPDYIEKVFKWKRIGDL